MSESSELRSKALIRIAELRQEIAGLEAVGSGTNEPIVRTLKAQLDELLALLAGPAHWRDQARERKARVVDAGAEYVRRRKR
jgi:hypothetical protein